MLAHSHSPARASYLPQWAEEGTNIFLGALANLSNWLLEVLFEPVGHAFQSLPSADSC
jgi:hypothetical protein